MIVHSERSSVIEDRAEAIKAQVVVMQMEPETWGDYSPRRLRQTAARLIDLDWRYGSGRLTEFPK